MRLHEFTDSYGPVFLEVLRHQNACREHDGAEADAPHETECDAEQL